MGYTVLRSYQLISVGTNRCFSTNELLSIKLVLPGVDQIPLIPWFSVPSTGIEIPSTPIDTAAKISFDLKNLLCVDPLELDHLSFTESGCLPVVKASA